MTVRPKKAKIARAMDEKTKEITTSMSSASIMDFYEKDLAGNNGEILDPNSVSVLELLKLIGPINTHYFRQACVLLQKHHYNATYARNIFFRQICLKEMANKNFSLFQHVYSKTYEYEKNSNVRSNPEQNSLIEKVTAIRDCKKSALSRLKCLNNVDLVTRICGWLKVCDLYHLGCCSTHFMKLLLIPESNVVWKTVLQKNFNVVVSENKQKFIKWKYSAQRLVEIIKSFSCPKCLKDGSIIPVLYGYPHRDLIARMNEKRIILGGDHIFPNSRIWQCINVDCKYAFSSWPYNDLTGSFTKILDKINVK